MTLGQCRALLAWARAVSGFFPRASYVHMCCLVEQCTKAKVIYLRQYEKQSVPALPAMVQASLAPLRPAQIKMPDKRQISHQTLVEHLPANITGQE